MSELEEFLELFEKECIKEENTLLTPEQEDILWYEYTKNNIDITDELWDNLDKYTNFP